MIALPLQLFFSAAHCMLAIGVGPRDWDQPFAGAEFIPADVEAFIHVEDPASLRARLEDHPLRAAALELLTKSPISDAWQALAAGARMDDEEMLDLLLGRDATFAFRRGDDGAIDWVASATVDGDSWSRFTERLDLRIGAPVHGAPILTLPEHEISMARLGSTVVAGPRTGAHDGLLADALALVAGASDDSLAQHEELAHALKLGGGDLGVFVRHSPPLGGTSAFALDLGRSALVVKHSSSFANSPFGDAPRPASVDRGLFGRLSEGAVGIMAQPLEMPSGALATFIRARLPHGALAPEVEDNLGERLFWLLIERPHGADMQPPGAAKLDLVIAAEVRNGAAGRQQIDALMAGLAQMLQDLVPAAAREPLERANLADVPAHQVRTIEIGPTLARLYPGLIDPQSVSLNWITIEGPAGNWCLAGSGPNAVHEVADTLLAPVELVDGGRSIDLDWQLGVVRGPQAAAHLMRLSALVSKALPEGDADGRGLDAVARVLAATLGSADRCVWKAELPSRNRVRSTWVLHFEQQSEGAGESELRTVDRRH